MNPREFLKEFLEWYHDDDAGDFFTCPSCGKTQNFHDLAADEYQPDLNKEACGSCKNCGTDIFQFMPA